MEAVAKMRNCPLSARKMRLVIDTIRGRDVDDALNVLKFSKKEASVWAEKTLLSAIANWEYKNDMAANADDHGLFIKEIRSDEGTMLKRFRPAPHGRAHRIRKRTNHLTIVVANRVPTTRELTGEIHDEEE
ncbi:MAG: 50S ribosomal protein L22 [Saprospiraceae bacterium]|nr:50S ribosomal protein L22 [Saprospiraceae bacterium]